MKYFFLFVLQNIIGYKCIVTVKNNLIFTPLRIIALHLNTNNSLRQMLVDE